MQTLIPWIPDAQKQAGPLYPWDHWATVGTGTTVGTVGLGTLDHSTHRATVGTGPQGALDHRGYWATGGTGSLYPLGPQWALYPSSGYSGLGHRQAGLPQYRSATTLQLRPARHRPDHRTTVRPPPSPTLPLSHRQTELLICLLPAQLSTGKG